MYTWLCCLSAGFDVQVVVLDTSVVGMLTNSSLPHIEVMPPSSGFNVTWSGLLMTIDVAAPGLIPFVEDKKRLLTGLVIQAGSLFFNMLMLLAMCFWLCVYLDDSLQQKLGFVCIMLAFSYVSCCCFFHAVVWYSVLHKPQTCRLCVSHASMAWVEGFGLLAQASANCLHLTLSPLWMEYLG